MAPFEAEISAGWQELNNELNEELNEEHNKAPGVAPTSLLDARNETPLAMFDGGSNSDALVVSPAKVGHLGEDA